MQRWLAAAALAGGCVGSPSIGVPAPPQPAVCSTHELAAPAGIDALSVAPTASGAVLVWAANGPVMREPLTPDLYPVLEPAVAWDGLYDAAFAGSIGNQVVVAAEANDSTFLVDSPLGYGEYRELAILGGRAGSAPVGIAGGTTFTAAVWYGGLRVNEIDDKWQVLTSQLGVASTRGTALATTAAGGEAVAVWPTNDACYVERVLDPQFGLGWADPIACNSPRLASTGHDSDVALVFETADGVYFARASATELHATSATLVAPGAHAPRIAAYGGAYWVSYLDASGAPVAGFVGDDGQLRVTTIAAAARAQELAIVGDLVRVFVVGETGTTAATLCAE